LYIDLFISYPFFFSFISFFDITAEPILFLLLYTLYKRKRVSAPLPQSSRSVKMQLIQVLVLATQLSAVVARPFPVPHSQAGEVAAAHQPRSLLLGALGRNQAAAQNATEEAAAGGRNRGNNNNNDDEEEEEDDNAAEADNAAEDDNNAEEDNAANENAANENAADGNAEAGAENEVAVEGQFDAAIELGGGDVKQDVVFPPGVRDSTQTSIKRTRG
jgi:hypothetical protein